MLNQLAKKIKQLRKQADLSLSQLADNADLSLTYIMRLEEGKYQKITLTTAKSLADGLGLSLRDFLEKIGYLEEEKPTAGKVLITQALRNNGYSSEQVRKIIEYAEFVRGQAVNAG